MPGLLTLRPLASAGKAAKSTSGKNAVSAGARAEKARDDNRAQGQGKVSPALTRARVMKAPSLYRAAPPTAPPRHHQQVAAPPKQPRLKQVTDPLGEAVKEKLRGNGLEISKRMPSADYSSSGSEHEPNSVCLAEMVFDYIEEDLEMGKCGRARCNCDSSCGGENSLLNEADDARSALGGEIADVLQGLAPCVTPCERSVFASVTSTLKALERVDGDGDPDCDEGDKSAQGTLKRRLVMTALRSSGYNAAICKSRWEHAGGFPGGDYDYIDVIVESGIGGKGERILVDIDFKAQFEIARPTNQYISFVEALSGIFVGKADRLQQIVNIMCDASKRSLKKKGMPLPPWRKLDYIRAKWFSTYRRTTNEAPLSSSRDYGTDIGKIALRATGWDTKFTNEMDQSYQKVADLKKALQECNAELGSRGIVASMLGKVKSRKHEDDAPEGKVRGADRMGMLVGNDRAVAATEWEVPKVIPRASHERAAAGKVRGLVSILLQERLSEEMTAGLGEVHAPLEQQIEHGHGGSLFKQILASAVV